MRACVCVCLCIVVNSGRDDSTNSRLARHQTYTHICYLCACECMHYVEAIHTHGFRINLGTNTLGQKRPPLIVDNPGLRHHHRTFKETNIRERTRRGSSLGTESVLCNRVPPPSFRQSYNRRFPTNTTNAFPPVTVAARLRAVLDHNLPG